MCTKDLVIFWLICLMWIASKSFFLKKLVLLKLSFYSINYIIPGSLFVLSEYSTRSTGI